MPRKRVPQRDLPRFPAELEEAGAREVHRSSADVHGMVRVRWSPSLAEDEQHRANVQAWKATYALHAVFLALVIVAALLALVLH